MSMALCDSWRLISRFQSLLWILKLSGPAKKSICMWKVTYPGLPSADVLGLATVVHGEGVRQHTRDTAHHHHHNEAQPQTRERNTGTDMIALYMRMFLVCVCLDVVCESSSLTTYSAPTVPSTAWDAPIPLPENIPNHTIVNWTFERARQPLLFTSTG